MQPMISPVDHESRHSSHRRQSDEEQVLTESSPLINRFPETSIPPRRNLLTLVTVGILLVVLVVGVVIGIRLLILQNDLENVLPPESEEMALRIITRQMWDNGSAPIGTSQPADILVAVQTDTRPCADEQTCAIILREMKATSGQDLPHNFLLSSDGRAYEAMGWRTSDLYRRNSSLVLAFIGNFTESPPSLEQVKAVQQFVGFAQSQQRLKPSFTIVGKNTRYSPKYLYQSLMMYPQWSSEFSDSSSSNTEVVF